MTKKKPIPQALSRDLSFTREMINEDERTVQLSFASEEPYERWFGPEVLQVDESAMDLSRFHEGLVCVLFNHDRDKVIGHVDNVWIENNRAMATIRFDDDEASDLIFQKVKSGTLQGVSVGYQVLTYKELDEDSTLANGRIAGPAYVATSWMPYEVSIVSIPADPSVGVGREFEPIEVESEDNMGDELKTTVEEKTVPAPEAEEKQVQTEQTNQRDIELERERCANIEALCRHFNVDSTEYIRTGTSLVDVQKAVLEQKKAERVATATVTITEDESDKYRAAVVDGMLMRAGMVVDNPATGADSFRGMALRTMFANTLEREGVKNAFRLDDNDLLKRALTGTGSLPGILSNIAHKSMAQGYQEAETTFQLFTSKGSVSDFKEHTVYQLSEGGDLKIINENGEFENDELIESNVTKRIYTFGKKFSFTRQMLINDDLSVLTRVPMIHAMAAKRNINQAVYRALTAKTLYDEAKKGNAAQTGAALALATLNAGRVAMRKQKGLRGKAVLNITPKFLIVPTELEFTALQLLNSTSDPTAAHAGVVNPLARSLTVIADAELDGIDTSAWYLAANPNAVDTIEVTYLNGNETPIIESKVSWDTLGIEYRMYLDYGVTALDYRGLYRNAGK